MEKGNEEKICHPLSPGLWIHLPRGPPLPWRTHARVHARGGRGEEDEISSVSGQKTSSSLGLSGLARNASPAREGGSGSSAEPTKAPAPVDPTCLLFLRRPGPESHQRWGEVAQSHDPLVRVRLEKGKGSGGAREEAEAEAGRRRGPRAGRPRETPIARLFRPCVPSIPAPFRRNPGLPDHPSSPRRVADCTATETKMTNGAGLVGKGGADRGAVGAPTCSPAPGPFTPPRPLSPLDPSPISPPPCPK